MRVSRHAIGLRVFLAWGGQEYLSLENRKVTRAKEATFRETIIERSAARLGQLEALFLSLAFSLAVLCMLGGPFVCVALFYACFLPPTCTRASHSWPWQPVGWLIHTVQGNNITHRKLPGGCRQEELKKTKHDARDANLDIYLIAEEEEYRRHHKVELHSDTTTPDELTTDSESGDEHDATYGGKDGRQANTARKACACGCRLS